MNEPPSLSVVIAASDSAEAVARALASIRAQISEDQVEIIVAAARDLLGPDGCPSGVRRVIAEEGTGVPRLRRLGFDASRAPLVVFTEDSCVFGPGWVASWRLAFEDPRIQAATGPVEPAMGDSPLDWAVFFCEYAPFLPDGDGRKILLGASNSIHKSVCRVPLAACPPVSQGPRRHRRASRQWHPERLSFVSIRIKLGGPTRLAGNNFAVRRAVVEGVGSVEVQESEVAASLPAGALTSTTALARHVRRYGVSEAIGDRLRFGLEYGRLRAARLPRFARGIGLLVGPAILLVQAARISRTVAGRRGCLGRYLECLPITLGLLSAWSVGEWIGWVLGPRRAPAGRRRETAARPPARASGQARRRRPRCTPAPPIA